MQSEIEQDTEALLLKLGIKVRKAGAELARRRRRIETVVHEAAGRRQWRLLERRLGEEIRKVADTGPGDWLDEEREVPRWGAASAEARARGTR